MNTSTSNHTAQEENAALFFNVFIPLLKKKEIQRNKAYWLLETTGAPDAADLQAELDAELKMLLQDSNTYNRLAKWERDESLQNPILKRQVNVLYRAFRGNQIPESLLVEISKMEASISMRAAQFRPRLMGVAVSDNDIREVLKKERNPEKRKRAWEASKEVGVELAPHILSLVDKRNQAARAVGFANYFDMQLALQEVDPKWLQETFDDLAHASDSAYRGVLAEIQAAGETMFGTQELGPWSWGDPFCQEDPLDVCELDALLDGVDFLDSATRFYAGCGFDVAPILARSDNFERPGKSQHAFCTHIDREGDVRTLNNLKPSLKWLETLLHELGHAVYELGYASDLPWLLREPPHMIPTEAMALLAGRQAYRVETLKLLVGDRSQALMLKAETSLRRRQLIFSRWVFVMTAFERELYRNPRQDLNQLWWKLVQEHQHIQPPSSREGKADWAAKHHIACAPVYYFSYLVGELLASAIQEMLLSECGVSTLTNPRVGKLLQERLFAPGNRFCWSELAARCLGRPLSGEAWLREFA